MSRAITILDLLQKLDTCVSRSRTSISITDLIEVYMLEPTHPQINTEGTFNEKVRLLKRLGILTPVNSSVYKVDWGIVDLRINQLTEGAA